MNEVNCTALLTPVSLSSPFIFLPLNKLISSESKANPNIYCTQSMTCPSPFERQLCRPGKQGPLPMPLGPLPPWVQPPSSPTRPRPHTRDPGFWKPTQSRNGCHSTTLLNCPAKFTPILFVDPRIMSVVFFKLPVAFFIVLVLSWFIRLLHLIPRPLESSFSVCPLWNLPYGFFSFSNLFFLLTFLFWNVSNLQKNWKNNTRNTHGSLTIQLTVHQPLPFRGIYSPYVYCWTIWKFISHDSSS